MGGYPDPGLGPLINRLANPPNPVETLGQDAQALDAVRQFQANQAGMQAYRAGLNPDGTVDVGRFNNALISGPGAYNAGVAMQRMGQGIGSQGTGQQAQFQAARDQLAAISGYLLPLQQQMGPDGKGVVTGQQVLDQAQLAVQAGVATPAMLANIQKQVASVGGPSANANSIVLGAAAGTLSGQQQLEALTGRPQPIPYGGGIALPQLSGSPLAQPSRAPIQTTLTPGEQIKSGEVPIGGGQTAIIPDWVAARGGAFIEQWLQQTYPGRYTPNSYQPPPPTAGGAPAPAAGGTRPGAAVTNQSFAPGAAPGRAGRYPGEVQPPPATGGGGGGGAPAPAPAPSPAPGGGGGGGGAEKTPAPLWLQPPTPVSPAAGGGGVGVTPAPWYATNVAKITGAASDAENTFAGQVNATKDVEPILKDMQSQLNVPGIDTGVGYTAINSVRQLAEKFGLTASKGEGNTEAMRAQDELNKDAARLAAAQTTAIGNPTDARQDLAQAANPGALQSTYGNKGIIQMLLGNQQALRVEADAWQKAKGGAGWTAGGDENNNFNTWRTDRFLAPDPNPGPSQGGRFDQRVFWLANAPTLDEQRTFAQKIPAGPARAQFVKNLTYANQQGWIKTDDKGLTTVTSP